MHLLWNHLLCTCSAFVVPQGSFCSPAMSFVLTSERPEAICEPPPQCEVVLEEKCCSSFPQETQIDRYGVDSPQGRVSVEAPKTFKE